MNVYGNYAKKERKERRFFFSKSLFQGQFIRGIMETIHNDKPENKIISERIGITGKINLQN